MSNHNAVLLAPPRVRIQFFSSPAGPRADRQRERSERGGQPSGLVSYATSVPPPGADKGPRFLSTLILFEKSPLPMLHRPIRTDTSSIPKRYHVESGDLCQP